MTNDKNKRGSVLLDVIMVLGIFFVVILSSVFELFGFIFKIVGLGRKKTTNRTETV